MPNGADRERSEYDKQTKCQNHVHKHVECQMTKPECQGVDAGGELKIEYF